MTIGFIGLGIMGSRMAHNLLKNRVPLIVHNRTPKAADPFTAAGAKWAERPCDAANVEILFTMLADPEAVEIMALGEGGFLGPMQPGSLWVDCSTVHPRFSRRMAAAAAERGVHFVDAPVTGTKPQAQEGQLVFFAGGSVEDMEVCRPYMDMMGRLVIHVGEQGMGTSMKVVINSLLALSMAAFSESVALGQALGLSEATLHQILVGGAVTAPFVAAKKAIIDEGAYDPPQFPLRLMYKDLLMVAEAARDTGIPMPLSEATKAIYAQAVDEGLGDDDFSAVYRFYNESRP